MGGNAETDRLVGYCSVWVWSVFPEHHGFASSRVPGIGKIMKRVVFDLTSKGFRSIFGPPRRCCEYRSTSEDLRSLLFNVNSIPSPWPNPLIGVQGKSHSFLLSGWWVFDAHCCVLPGLACRVNVMSSIGINLSSFVQHVACDVWLPGCEVWGQSSG